MSPYVSCDLVDRDVAIARNFESEHAWCQRERQPYPSAGSRARLQRAVILR